MLIVLAPNLIISFLFFERTENEHPHQFGKTISPNYLLSNSLKTSLFMKKVYSVSSIRMKKELLLEILISANSMRTSQLNKNEY